MFRSPSLYLSQLSSTINVPPWSLNKALEHAIERYNFVDQYSSPDFFAEIDECQFSPWTIQERLAFGQDLLPKLVRQLDVIRREPIVLQKLRSLEHLISDPELGREALNLNVLKSLTSLLIWGSETVKFWSLACVRVLVGNPLGKSGLTDNHSLMNEIIKHFSATEKHVQNMCFDILRLLSENWFAVNVLQQKGCIKLVLSTIFSVLHHDAIYGNEKVLVCLLETLVNLIDYKRGVMKAIRYNLFDLTWLLTCGLQEVEKATMKVFASVAKDEIGQIGLINKGVVVKLLSAFRHGIDGVSDPISISRALMFSTLPSQERRNYAKMNAVETILDVLRYPNVSNASRLVLVKLLTNMAELPEGRAIIKNHLESLLTVKACGKSLQKSYASLLKKTLESP